jgi:hypothetical protein
MVREKRIDFDEGFRATLEMVMPGMVGPEVVRPKRNGLSDQPMTCADWVRCLQVHISVNVTEINKKKIKICNVIIINHIYCNPT